MAKPSIGQWTAAKAVLRYIASIMRRYITFRQTHAPMRGYSDADYAGDSDNRTSSTDFVFIVNGGAFSWNSGLQPAHT